MRIIYALLVMTQIPAHGLSERLSSAQKQLSALFYRCPTRVWPGADWNAATVILVENEQAYKVTQDKLIPDQLMPSEQAALSSSVYAMSASPQRIAVKLTSDEEYPQKNRKITDLAVQIAQHEGFHLFQQDFGAHPWWPAFLKFPPDGAKTYPVLGEPYYYYQRLIENLQGFISTSDSSSLAKANSWYQKLRAEYPYFLDELTGGSMLEGAAVYAELVGAVLAKRGCDTAEENIFSDIMKDHARLLPTDEYGDISQTDFIYNYAPYIFLAIRKLKRQDELAGLGQTGLLFDLLFKDTPQQPDIDEKPEMRAEIKKLVAEANAGITPQPAPLIAAFNAKDKVKLSFPNEQVRIETSGSYLKFGDLSARTTASFQLGEVSFESPIFYFGKDPCGVERSVILVDAVQNGKARVGESSIDVSDIQPKSFDGSLWYCFSGKR